MQEYLVQDSQSKTPVVRPMTKRSYMEFKETLDETKGEFIIKIPYFDRAHAYEFSKIKRNNLPKERMKELVTYMVPGGNTEAAYDALTDYFYN